MNSVFAQSKIFLTWFRLQFIIPACSQKIQSGPSIWDWNSSRVNRFAYRLVRHTIVHGVFRRAPIRKRLFPSLLEEGACMWREVQYTFLALMLTPDGMGLGCKLRTHRSKRTPILVYDFFLKSCAGPCGDQRDLKTVDQSLVDWSETNFG